MNLGPAIAALNAPGGVVLYPTETLYGLGGRASDSVACARVNTLKGSEGKPLVVLVNGIPDWLDPRALSLAQDLWPGPVTLVVAAPDGFADGAQSGDGTLAVRWSPHRVVGALVAAVVPITSTSANRHGAPPIETPSALEFSVDAVIDVGILPPCSPSTLVDSRSGRILREGAGVERVRAALDHLGLMP